MTHDLYSCFRVIQSKANDLVKQLIIHQEGGFKANKLRKESGLAVIEGIHLLDAWLKADKLEAISTIVTNPQGLEHPQIKTLLFQVIDACQAAGQTFPDLVLIEEGVEKSFSMMPEGPFLQCCVQVSHLPIDYTQDIVILDAIQDAGNVGSILRTCAAAGFTQIIATKGTATIWSNKVLRAGMGAQVSLSILEGVAPFDILADLELPLLSAQLSQAKSLYEITDQLKSPIAWVFGNEGQGVSPILSADALGVMIPQVLAVESLNVSAAVAVALFETRRVRLHVATAISS